MNFTEESISKLQAIIQESHHAVFYGGAGVSTESGIPDFYSGDGPEVAVEKYGNPPEILMSHEFFLRHPEIFYDFYINNMIWPDAKPNEAHKALARLEHTGHLDAIVTINIDGLHQKAGSNKVYELHGTTQDNYCIKCGAHETLQEVLDKSYWIDGVPRCRKCGGIMKPYIVFYGEMLHEKDVRGTENAFSQADTLIIGGTRELVYPASVMVNSFHGKHLVVINNNATPYDRNADLVIHDRIGKVMGMIVDQIQ
ncbi:MAG: NAD-dependent protein deacylase [Anaerovoracaceae bacterium]|jgi:NAD-dependent deacetylase